MLLQELNHRVKNTLATVQALARRTLEGDASGRYERFEGRLLSLSKNHNLLRPRNGKAKASRHRGSGLAPYKGRFGATGPNFSCQPVALGLSMVIHELGQMPRSRRVSTALDGIN